MSLIVPGNATISFLLRVSRHKIEEIGKRKKNLVNFTARRRLTSLPKGIFLLPLPPLAYRTGKLVNGMTQGFSQRLRRSRQLLRKDFAPTKADVYTGYVTLIFGVKCRRNSAAVLSRNIYLVYDHACLSMIYDVGS